MQVVLVIVSVIALVLGLSSLTVATEGAGIIAVGCWFAIHARIVQSGAQHRELMASLGAEAQRMVPATQH